MSRLGALLGLAAGLSLAACAGGAPTASEGPSSPAATQTVGVQLMELPPQRLTSGQCALALWSRTTKPERVLMAFNEPAVARIQVQGRTMDVPLVSREGRQSFGHFPVQVYANERLTLTVRVNFEPRDQLIGGAVARNGAIEIVDAQGWSAAIPVGGIVACEP